MLTSRAGRVNGIVPGTVAAFALLGLLVVRVGEAKMNLRSEIFCQNEVDKEQLWWVVVSLLLRLLLGQWTAGLRASGQECRHSTSYPGTIQTTRNHRRSGRSFQHGL
jgi:hypothetical protein